MIWQKSTIIVLIILNMSRLVAQEVITVDNISRLESTARIDFPTDAFETGWFVVSDDARYAATVSLESAVVIWDLPTQRVSETYTVTGADGLPARVINADFAEDTHLLAAIHNDGATNFIAYHFAVLKLRKSSPPQWHPMIRSVFG